MPRKTEVQSSTKKEHHLLQILWPPLHLILEECQPVFRRVSFHKRRSSVRKSEKDAIGTHLIQAADNDSREN